jgi:Neuraminidase (sialidase)
MLTLAAIHEGLEANLEALDDLVAEVQKAGHDAATTEAHYKTAFAKARLTIKATAMDKMTVGDIDAEATVQCEELYLNYLIAQNKLTTVREALRAVQSKLDGYRSLAASYRQAGG